MVAGEMVNKITRQRKQNIRIADRGSRIADLNIQIRINGTKSRILARDKADKPMAIPAKAMFL